MEKTFCKWQFWKSFLILMAEIVNFLHFCLLKSFLKINSDSIENLCNRIFHNFWFINETDLHGNKLLAFQTIPTRFAFHQRGILDFSFSGH